MQSNQPYNDVIEVRNPKTLKTDKISVQRIPIGQPGDYKPCIAKLPNGELLLVLFQMNKLDCTKRLWGRDVQMMREDILLFRSQDGGISWSEPEILPILGREPYFSILSDGTILITVHLLQQDVRNVWNYTRAFIHRSTDGGRSWLTIPTEPEEFNFAEGTQVCTTRNILELNDGSLIVGTSPAPPCKNYIWRSFDKGATWNEQYSSQLEGVGEDYPYSFFGEGVFFQVASGKIYLIQRIEPAYFAKGDSNYQIPEGYSDEYDKMILFSSTDFGHSWQQEGDFGGMCEMYPAVLRLNDGRLLLTFTVRARNNEPLGVRAVLGKETEDSFEFDFENDRIMIETKTPMDLPSGGGFGPTIQLDDGTLITSYSYRTDKGNESLHCEIVRWRLD